MFGVYRSKFPELHQATVERVTKALEGVRLASFTPGVALDFIETAPKRPRWRQGDDSRESRRRA